MKAFPERCMRFLREFKHDFADRPYLHVEYFNFVNKEGGISYYNADSPDNKISEFSCDLPYVIVRNPKNVPASFVEFYDRLSDEKEYSYVVYVDGIEWDVPDYIDTRHKTVVLFQNKTLNNDAELYDKKTSEYLGVFVQGGVVADDVFVLERVDDKIRYHDSALKHIMYYYRTVL